MCSHSFCSLFLQESRAVVRWPHDAAIIQIVVRRMYFETECMAVQCSRLPKVVDFGTNRKSVCNFLLVINSNLGPIFQIYCSLFCWKQPLHSYFMQSLWMFPTHLCIIADVEAPKSKDSMLMINVTQPILSRFFNVTNGRTDGQTASAYQYRALHYVHRAVNKSIYLIYFIIYSVLSCAAWTEHKPLQTANSPWTDLCDCVLIMLMSYVCLVHWWNACV